MGLAAPVAELIVLEASYRAIRGDVAVLGRQTTYVTEANLNWLLQKYGLPRVAGLEIEPDFATAGAGEIAIRAHDGRKLELITDRTFFRALGADSFSAIDVSAYEGADIICDLSRSVPPELYGRFDFIYDGSSLDNIFNPAEAMSNMSRMLRPGGRLIIAEHGSLDTGAYTAFSPGWFFDFFAANGYRDCKIYVGGFIGPVNMLIGPWGLYVYNWHGEKNGFCPPIQGEPPTLVVIAIAEKGERSTDDVYPVQFQYRDRVYHDSVFAENVAAMTDSPRPLYGLPFGGRRPQECPDYLPCPQLGGNAPF